MTAGDVNERVGFRGTDEGVCVRDRLADTEVLFRTDERPTLRVALTDVFPFPVDRAVTFETGELDLGTVAHAAVREEHGGLIAHLQESTEFPAGTYCIEISDVVKVYLRVTDARVDATGVADADSVRLTFDGSTRVVLGARSMHPRPEATITVPDDPESYMRAVSLLGSSIKEFSAEQSWPTLRGYPPRIVDGDTLEIPEGLSVPDTGVRITVPPTHAAVHRIAPLAFYLGATVEADPEPAIRLDTGYAESLPEDGAALEERVAELLGSVLLLDSLARVEGYDPSDRYEYHRLGAKLPFYPPNIADDRPADRLMEYLEVAPSTLESYHLLRSERAVLRPGPADVPLVSHLVHLLSPVTVRERRGPWLDAGPATGVGSRPAPQPGLRVPEFDRSAMSPIGGSLPLASYENRLDRTLSVQGEADVVLVTGSEERAASLRRAMRLGDGAPDGVGSWSVVSEPNETRLRNLLSDPSVDVLHCELPTDGRSVSGVDGQVDLAKLETGPTLATFTTPPEAIDAASFGRGPTVEAGERVVAAGALGALALPQALDPKTIRTFVGLLAIGTPTGAAVDLLDLASSPEVAIVGDPAGIAVVGTDGLSVNVLDARSETTTSHRVRRWTVPSTNNRFGSESRYLPEWAGECSELIGTPRDDYPTLSTGEVLMDLEEPDLILRLNGDVVLTADGYDEVDVERSARQALGMDVRNED